MNEKSDVDIIAVGNCDMKQHLYKNVDLQMDLQRDIDGKKSGAVNAVFGKW